MQIFQKLFQNRESRSIFIRQVSDSFRLFITPVPNYYVLQSYDENGDSINFGFFCEKIPGFRGSKNFFLFLYICPHLDKICHTFRRKEVGTIVKSLRYKRRTVNRSRAVTHSLKLEQVMCH